MTPPNDPPASTEPDLDRTIDLSCREDEKPTQRMLSDDATVAHAGTHSGADPDVTIAYRPREENAAVSRLEQERRIGNYLLLSEIARGGMGVVYKARQLGLNRIVALKMTLAGQFTGEEERKRFRLEAEAAGQLDHPNIVPIYEVSEHQGLPYFSMGYVDGESLKGKLAGGPLPPRESAEFVRTIAEAVQYAHDKGVVHRDLKPANVLVDSSGQPRITDFGLAKQSTVDSELTATGQILGTPSFMPPEQAMGDMDQVGPLSDVYSLGATLYCLLTGRPPFQAASMLDTLMQVARQQPVAPRDLNIAIPQDIETICLKCLEKSPEQRYSSAQALADDLSRFLAGEPVLARPLGPAMQAWRWCHRNPMAASLYLSVLALLLMLSVGVWYRAKYAATAASLSAAQALKRVSDFHAGLARVRETMANPRAGWTWHAEDELAKARLLADGKDDQREVANLLIDVLSVHDFRKTKSIKTGITCGAIAFSPDGKKVAVGQGKHATGFSVRVYSTESTELVADYSVSTLGTSISKLFSGSSRYQDGTRSLAWSPDGRWLVAGSRFGKLIRWDTQLPSATGTTWQAGERPINKLAFTGDGHTLLSLSDSLMTWDCTNDWGRLSDKPVEAFALARSENLLITYDASPNASVAQGVRQGTNVGAWPNGISQWVHAVSPDGRFVVGTESAKITVRCLQNGELVMAWPVESGGEPIGIDDLFFTSEGQVLVGIDLNQQIHFWDVNSGKELFAPIASNEPSCRVAVSPTAGLLAFNDSDENKVIQLYELRVPSAALRLNQTGRVRDVDFSQSNNTLAIVSKTDAVIRNQEWLELSQWDLISHEKLSSTQSIQQKPGLKIPMLHSLDVHPTDERIAWHADFSGTMMYSPSPQSGAVSFLNVPDFPEVVELSAEDFVWNEFSQGSSKIRLASGGQVAMLETGGELRTESRIAIQLGNLPPKGHKGGWSLMACVEASRKAGTTNAGLAMYEVGSSKADNDASERATTLYSPTNDQNSQSQWCPVAIFQPGQKGNDDRMGLIATLPERSDAALSLTVKAVALTPLHEDSEDNHDGAVPIAIEHLTWSPDGNRIWGFVDGRKALVGWNGNDLKPTSQWNNRLSRVTTGLANLSSLVVSSKFIVCGGQNGMVTVLPAGTGDLTPLEVFNGPGGDVRAVVVSADSAWAAIGTQVGKAELRALPSGEKLAEVTGLSGSVQSMVLSSESVYVGPSIG